MSTRIWFRFAHGKSVFCVISALGFVHLFVLFVLPFFLCTCSFALCLLILFLARCIWCARGLHVVSHLFAQFAHIVVLSMHHRHHDGDDDDGDD